MQSVKAADNGYGTINVISLSSFSYKDSENSPAELQFKLSGMSFN
jgi:hypothetical protein